MIDTGGTYGCNVSNYANQIVKSANIILFDDKSTSNLSSVFVVPSNTAFLIVAYDIPADVNAVVNMVSISTMAMPHACDSPCCIDIDMTTPILYRIPMTLGGKVWRVSEANRQLLLVLPGFYQLELSQSESLSAATIEGIPLRNVATVLPFQYAAGIAGV